MHVCMCLCVFVCVYIFMNFFLFTFWFVCFCYCCLPDYLVSRKRERLDGWGSRKGLGGAGGKCMIRIKYMKKFQIKNKIKREKTGYNHSSTEIKIKSMKMKQNFYN